MRRFLLVFSLRLLCFYQITVAAVSVKTHSRASGDSITIMLSSLSSFYQNQIPPNEHSGLSKKPALHVHLWDFHHSFPALIDCFSGEVMRQCEPSSEHCTSLFLRRNGSFSSAAFRPVKLYGQQPETDFSNKAVSYVRESEIEEQQMCSGGSEVLLGWYGKCESGKGFLFQSQQEAGNFCMSWQTLKEPECFAHGPQLEQSQSFKSA